MSEDIRTDRIIPSSSSCTHPDHFTGAVQPLLDLLHFQVETVAHDREE
jgi:hypothetical protein